ncbi:MAG TPA: hypothetical protein V6C69_09765 [Trichormus sp.]|jgi:hypothetical protein
MFSLGKAAAIGAAVAAMLATVPANAAARKRHQLPGVLTPYTCIDSADDSASSQFVTVVYGARREGFITAQLTDNNYFVSPTANSAGAVLDGLEGTAFSSFSTDIVSSTLPPDLSLLKFKFFGDDSDTNNLTVNVTAGNATLTVGKNRGDRTTPPRGYTRFTFTSNQLGSNFAQISQVFIELRANGSNTTVGPVTFGHVVVNGSITPTNNFKLTGCPLNN